MSEKLSKLNILIDVLQPNNRDYAVILPNKIILTTGADESDIEKIVKKEENTLKKVNVKQIWKNEVVKNRISITLIPTFDCNLRCIYCYARGGEDKSYMSKEIARASINAIRSQSSAKELRLYFAGGGEPFMNFEVMRFAVDYAKKLFRRVYSGVVTNGTFNTKQLKWILENNVSLRISCDGIAHNLQRPFPSDKKSLDVVEKNIKKLISLHKEFMAQCIITSFSVKNLLKSIDYFATLGVKTIKVEPVHISKISRGNEKLIPRPEVYVENFIKMLKYINMRKLPIKIDTSFLSRPTTGYYCGICGENLTVTPNGDITACVEITKRTDPFSDTIIYGKIAVDKNKFIFNEKAIAKLKMLHFHNYKGCNKCPLRLICKGGCPMKNIWAHGLISKPSKYTCQIERMLIPKIFSLLTKNVNYAKIIFDEFQINLC